MIEKLEPYLERYQEIKDKLEEDPSLYQEYGKEFASLEELVSKINLLQKEEESSEELKQWMEMSEDPKEKNQIREEIKKAEANLEDVKNDIKEYFKRKNEAKDDGAAILEIRPGTGGVESTLFAADLMKMYVKFAHLKGWKVEEQSLTINDQQGVKEVCLLLKNNEAYKTLKYESGVHRVQRVPETEASGRIHTSAATVAVLPEEKTINIKIDEKDLRIDVYRSGGKGGQSVNTTDSAVRITHLPTGIVVAQQDERSQLQNKQKAMKTLRMRVYQKMIEDEESERAKDRKDQVGSGDRSERIRTYNFPQNRVTDHRINKSWHNMEEVLNGNLLQDISHELIVAANASSEEF